MMNHEQPMIHPHLIQRLNRISVAYEMEPERMLNFILSVSLDELEGRQNEYTVCVPTNFEDATT